MISVTVAPPTHRIVRPERVVEELGSACDDDAMRLLARIVDRASSAARSYCNRDFAEQRVTEILPGQGGTRLILSLAPIVQVHSVAFDGMPVTDFEIEDRKAGFLYRRSGWRWTSPATAGQWYGGEVTEPGPVPGEELPLYSVDYTAGFVLPTFPSGYVKNANSQDLPDDLEGAVAMLAKDSWHQRAAKPAGVVSSIATTGISVTRRASGDSMAQTRDPSTGFPLSALSVLDRYQFIK